MCNRHASVNGRTPLPIKIVSDMLRTGARVVSIGLVDGSTLHALDNTESLELTVVARPTGAVRVIIPKHRQSMLEFPAHEKTFSLSDVVSITTAAKKK